MKLTYRVFRTPIGLCAVVADARALRSILMRYSTEKALLRHLRRRYPQAEQAATGLGKYVTPLKEYFRGRRKSFHLPIALNSCTTFQRRVYKALASIPYGEVRTYGWVARKTGKPKASRAVGNAVARNPLPIIIPCHRVIRSDGSIGGFSAPRGPMLKRKLLKLEGVSL